MLKKLSYLVALFTITFITTPQYSNAQGHIYLGGHNYPSESLGTFKGEKKDVDVTIGKKKNGKGVILLKTDSDLHGGNFGGPAYLFLSNGKRIKCYDRNITDKVNNNNKSLYFLSKKDIRKLKKNNIVKIRFTIGVNKYNKGNTYTAKNIELFRKISGELERHRFNTTKDFTELFRSAKN